MFQFHHAAYEVPFECHLCDPILAVLMTKKSVTTDIGDDASFGLRVSRSKAPAGAAITATATDAEGNTSEFSGAKQVG